MAIYFVAGMILGFLLGIILKSSVHDDISKPHRDELDSSCYCDCKKCEYMVVISGRDEGCGKRKIVPFVSCIKFPTWHDAPMACSFFKSTTNLNGN